MKKISRRTFVAGSAAVAATAGIGGFFIHRNLKSRPNIILFIADDMRFDAAGFAGNALIRTPNLDALADDGYVFENSFATTAICPISRASIISGEYALKHHVYTFMRGMNPASMRHSFPVLLRQAGYHTGFVGKWGQAGKQPVKDFDHWLGYQGQGDYVRKGQSGHLTDVQTRQTLHFLEKRPKDKPFLLIVAYKSPHGPFISQERFAQTYKDTIFPRSVTDTPEAFARLPEPLKASHGKKEYNKVIWKDDAYQKFMRNYYGLITGLDDSIGTVLGEIRKQTDRDTSVLFTSDNGLLNGDHALMGKWCMYEGSIRVPLIINPSLQNRTPARLQAMALNIDISPTILSLASLSIPGNVQGRSLLPAMRSVSIPWRDGFYYEHPAGNRTYHIVACEGYRSADWKYTIYKAKKFAECLFDLKNDPRELNNLAQNPDYREKLQEMRQLTQAAKKSLS
jgi:arylsulfatase A-like enzyme